MKEVGRPKDEKRKDKRGRLKETRHGTRHFTSWRPEAPERALTRRAKAECSGPKSAREGENL